MIDDPHYVNAAKPVISRMVKESLDRVVNPPVVVKTFTENISLEDAARINKEAFESLREGDDMAKGGVKFDEGKTRDDLLPPEVEEAIATVLAFGARKYAERNWEMGMLWSRPYAAARRHLRNWFARRDFGHGPGKDKDSGYSDLWHAATNVAFLIAYELRGKGTDDRPHVV